MKRISLVVVVAGLACVAWWWPRSDRPADVLPRDEVRVSARPTPLTNPSPALAEDSASMVDEPGDSEPGIEPAARETPGVPLSAAVPPLPRTIKLAAGAEPPLPPAEPDLGIVELSDDGKTASLKVDSRKTPNYVYDISCRDVADPEKPFFPAYGFFTLHKIPTE